VPESKKEHDHVVLNSLVDGGRLECRNCGDNYSPTLPCSLDIYVNIMETFLSQHKECKDPDSICKTCEGEGTVEGDRVCGSPSRGGCADGMCGGCFAVDPCPECRDEGLEEPDWDAMREARDEVAWEVPD